MAKGKADAWVSAKRLLHWLFGMIKLALLAFFVSLVFGIYWQEARSMESYAKVTDPQWIPIVQSGSSCS